MATATISTKGQVTLPAEVRRRLKLKPGDRIDFVFDANGRLVVQTKRKPFERLRGMIKSPYDGALTKEQIRAALSRGRAEDDDRIKREWNEQESLRSRK